MLCAPPMCQPATHFLGCFSLRTGAKFVLVLNTLYGLTLVLVHSLLLGEVKEPRSEQLRLEEMRTLERRLQEGEEGKLPMSRYSIVGGYPAAHRALFEEEGMAERSRGEATERGGTEAETRGRGEAAEGGHGGEAEGEAAGGRGQQTEWWLQFLDLDFGFGHQLLGLADQTNIVTGLIYGVIVTGASMYVLQAVQSNSPTLPATARWFTSFAHLQILLYAFIQLVKCPKLCKVIQKEYLTHLYMECDVLLFIYVGRTVIYMVIFSFGTWIFASFSFVLTFGHGAHAVVDRPEYGHALDAPGAAPGAGQEMKPGGGYPGGYPRGPLASGASHFNAPPSRHNLVGHAAHAPSPSYGGGHAAQPPGRHPMAGGGHGASYNIGRMPRATSSMATSASGYSTEQHPLIKPPVAIY